MLLKENGKKSLFPRKIVFLEDYNFLFYKIFLKRSRIFTSFQILNWDVLRLNSDIDKNKNLFYNKNTIKLVTNH